MRSTAAALMLCMALAPFARADDEPQDLPIGANPGAIESTNQNVDAKAKLAVGQVLQVKWGNAWWAAKIVALNDDGKVKITYVGWAKNWDEWVTRDRLQLDKDAVKKAKAGKPLPVVLPRWMPAMWPPPRPLPAAPAPPQQEKKAEQTWNPGPVPSSRIEVPIDVPLSKGRLLQVMWGNRWWGAKVLETKPDGTVKIRYVGWSKSWDEWVSRDRLQFDTNPPSVIDVPPATPR